MKICANKVCARFCKFRKKWSRWWWRRRNTSSQKYQTRAKLCNPWFWCGQSRKSAQSSKIFAMLRPYFAQNERFWRLYECMGITSAVSMSRRYYSRSRVSPWTPTCCQNFGHFGDMSKFNCGSNIFSPGTFHPAWVIPYQYSCKGIKNFLRSYPLPHRYCVCVHVDPLV